MGSENDWIGKLMSDNVATYAAGLDAGIASEHRKIVAIVHAYERAVADANARIPSYLTAAIEAARQNSVNDRANGLIKRDQVEPQWERDARTGARDPR